MNRRGLIAGVFAAALALLAGCASPGSAVQVHMLAPPGSYAPVHLVQVLTAPPAQPYTEIARLETTGAPGATAAQVIDVLQKKAAALGADALIVSEHTQTGAPQLQFNPVGGQYQMQPGLSLVQVQALAIRLQGKTPGTSVEHAK